MMPVVPINQRGQALAEFLAISVAIIPLFLLMPMIAKYQDVSHSTQMASRYAAFDAMNRNDAMGTWKPESQLADEVRRRFFSNSDAPIKTNDVAGNFKANQNLFWVDPKDDSLIKSFNSDVTVSYGFGGSAVHSGGFSGTQDGLPFTLSKQLDLQARGIYTANVSVKLANLPSGLRFYEPFDKINVVITRSSSLLFDAWAAKSPEQVEDRIANDPTVFPVGDLKAFQPIADAAVLAIDPLAGVPGPKLGDLSFWRDMVPKDRLK